jgi:hypothetical protein
MKNGILGLFVLLVIILMIKPRVFYNLYNHILGRVLLIGVVLFFTMFNVTLGLLAALCLIIVSNMFFMEGLDNMTIGDDTVVSPDEAKIKVSTRASKKEKEEEEVVVGVDRQRVHETIQPKSSKTIPVDKNIFNSEDVSPNESSSQVLEGLMNKYATV